MKMIGKAATHGFLCKCCVSPAEHIKIKRSVKRSEKAEWKRAVRMLDTP